MSRAAFYASLESPFGTVWIAVSARGVAMSSVALDEAEFCHELEIAGYEPEYGAEGTSQARHQLEQFFAGSRRSFDVGIDLSSLPAFPRSVLEAVAEVPYGEVRSYADIAFAVGKARAARAVGTALSRNPVSFFVPCHRIIRSDGTLGEYGARIFGRSGSEFKRRLLLPEGVAL